MNRHLNWMCTLVVAVLFVSITPGWTADRPNILWITSEDNSPYLGCYGDTQARTPHLDQLAAQGVRYRNAFSSAPVCSAARSTLISGLHASSAGLHNHRSSVAIPAGFQLYPDLLRKAGYFCTNNSKTDYNISVQGKRGTTACWDQSSGKAHYKNRSAGQPFFAVFNLGISHEGQTTDRAYTRRRQQGLYPAERVVSPKDVKLPPYHADTPVVRENWSRYYDNMWLLDTQVGDLLAELEQSGQAENTIVFYYGDHGGALPRGKRNIHDSGTRVPLIIRFPEKYQHLASTKASQWVDAPVAFVDFPATLLSLLDIPIPGHYEGKAFLGSQAKAHDHVFLFRGRMDERYDTVRAVRTEDALYINNLTPHRAWGQYYFYPFNVMPSMDAWYQAYLAGRCNPVQARYWQTKPGEEFYVIESDPYQINNLIDKKEHARTIRRLRQTLRDRLVETRDAGLIPEGMYAWLPGDQTVYEYAHSHAYPIDAIVDLAFKATSRDRVHLASIKAALSHTHPVMRYWAATGCVVLGMQAIEAKEALAPLIRDVSADVRVVAAEALAHMGEIGAAKETLLQVIKTGNPYEGLAAINTLEMMARDSLMTGDELRALLEGTERTDLMERVMDAIKTL
jgi:N-sulfoglucosamine sulfohydrolase